MITKLPMDPEARSILKAIPEETAERASRKKSYYVSDFHPMDCPSFWDEGSKSYWTFYNLKERRVMMEMPSNHPFYEAGRPYQVNKLPPDCILIKTGYFMGKIMTAHFYVAPQGNLMEGGAT